MIDTVINRIKDELVKTFKEVDNWFNTEDSLLRYNPRDGGWSIGKILEHISLTNYFLLILIRKGTRKALEVSVKNEYSSLLENYDLDWTRLKQIGEHKSFEWRRPEHMKPKGTADLTAIRNKLHDQLEECQDYLGKLKNGEGVLYKTMMTVNALGKIDVYHYIYFLAQHAKRHLTQIQRIREEYKRLK